MATTLLDPLGPRTSAGSSLNEPPTVFEISLLLPATWASRLVDQANLEKVTVAQFLRGVIGDALAERHKPLAHSDHHGR